jgi:Signal transduction histidine kinase
MQDNIILLETLIDNMPCNVYWMDKNCVMLGCNRNVLNMLNTTKKEYLGKTYEEIGELAHWSKGLAEKFKQDDLRVLNSGEPIFGVEEPPIPLPDQTELYLLTSRVPLRNRKGDIVGVAGISVDISNLKKARDDAQAANRAKIEFIANMSHDIRTPLTGIIGAANALSEANLSAEDQQSAEMIAKSGERLLELLNSVLELVKSDNLDKNHVARKTFSLFTLVDNLHALLLPSFKAKNLDFITELDPQIPPYLINDPIKLERILLNLISNAIKFTDKGHIKLAIQFVETSDKPVTLHFSVSDTGIGISKNKIDHVFDRFFRVNPSEEGIYRGHGVGLSIVKQYVTLLGGNITVSSKKNQGTTFEFTLSMPEGMASEATTLKVSSVSLPTPPYTTQANLTHRTASTDNAIRVLFLEDDAIAAKVGSHLFTTLGCEVEIASNAQEALTLLNRDPFDLIITDVGLPDLSGNEFALLWRYRETIKQQLPIPIIALSGHADEAITQTCLAAGMNHVLTKPLSKDQAKQILDTFCSPPDKPSTHTKSITNPNPPLRSSAINDLGIA